MGERLSAVEGVVVVTDADATFWATRRVLVTGASGMVGSWLTRWLVEAGAHVAVLIVDHDPQSELFRSGIAKRTSVVDGSLTSFDDVERAVVGHEVDTVFHLGAQTIVGTAHRSPRATFEANIAGTWNVLDACRLHADLVERVVVASSDKAYGEQQLPYTEASRLEGRHPYEVSKSCTDLLTTSYAVTYGVAANIARCGNIYGGGDLNWSRIVPGTMRSLLRGEVPVLRSDGTFLRDYLHVDDIVSAYLLLAERTGSTDLVGEAFNFSDERPLSVLDLYAAICDVSGFAGQQPDVQNRAVGEIKDQYLDAAKAHEVLGWSANTGLSEGLQKTFEWYRNLLQEEAA